MKFRHQIIHDRIPGQKSIRKAEWWVLHGYWKRVMVDSARTSFLYFLYRSSPDLDICDTLTKSPKEAGNEMWTWNTSVIIHRPSLVHCAGENSLWQWQIMRHCDSVTKKDQQKMQTNTLICMCPKEHYKRQQTPRQSSSLCKWQMKFLVIMDCLEFSNYSFTFNWTTEAFLDGVEQIIDLNIGCPYLFMRDLRLWWWR